MSYTRDWSNTTPIDHSKFKDQPGHVRSAKVDIEERLQNFMYGFTAGETQEGLKFLPFIVQGTAPTTAADKIILHGSDVNSKCELWLASEDGTRTQLTSLGKFLLSGAKVPNDTYLLAVDSTGTGTVNIVKCTTGNVLSFLGGVTIDSTGNLVVPALQTVSTLAISGTAQCTGLFTFGGGATGHKGNVISHNTSVSTSLSATATSSYADCGLTAITFTPSNAANIIIIAWGLQAYNNANYGGLTAAINIDGTTQESYASSCNNGNANSSSDICNVTGALAIKLSAAEHVIKIYMKAQTTAGGTVTAQKAYLNIMEVFNG